MEDKERFISVEQRGIRTENSLIEYSQRTKSNTHRIDKLEDDVKALQKETGSLGEFKAILRVQTEANVNQARHMEKLDEILTSTNQNLTELNFITKQLQTKQEALEAEAKEGRFTWNQIGAKIFWGIVAIIPALILAWISMKAGLK